MGEQNINITPKDDGVKIINESYHQHQVHDWNPKNYKLNSIKAIVDLVKTKGDKKNTVVLYDEVGIDVILDETIQNKPLDHCVYRYCFSLQFADWNKVFTIPFSQKQAVEFLRSRTPGEVEDIDSLIANIANIKVATTIVGDYSDDDEGNIVAMYKEDNGKEGRLRIPKEINVTMPIFKETIRCNMIFEVKLIKPRNQEEKPKIVFNCCRKDYYIQEAANVEIMKLKEGLEGYLILSGRAKG